VLWIYSDPIAGEIMLKQPIDRLAAQRILANGTYDPSVGTKASGMASEIRWGTTKEGSVRIHIPEDFTEPDYDFSCHFIPLIASINRSISLGLL
jgi:hypothetical protein